MAFLAVSRVNEFAAITHKLEFPHSQALHISSLGLTAFNETLGANNCISSDEFAQTAFTHPFKINDHETTETKETN
jgi:hypothetical protein